MRLEKLKNKISTLPLEPGVYLMKDGDGGVIYVGKAVSLRKRVSSYFNRSNLHGPKIAVLVKNIRDIDVIETPTEVDALLLEASLINKYSPKYNTRQKDDKSFPLIKISDDKFPLVSITRNKMDRKAIYYGPYTDAYLLREAVKIIHSLFPIRKCKTLPAAPCLYYHLKQCLAPCIHPGVKKNYDKLVDEIRSFLGGGKRSFIDYLTDKMKTASAKYRYEEAGVFKEQIEALGRLRKRRYHDYKPIAGIGLAATRELKRVFGLSKIPERISCVDISNTGGSYSVASKVTFHRELPDKNEYRKYRIKTVEGPNDYASIAEVIRRFVRRIKTGEELFPPDLLMIDGGKGQLNAALKVFEEEEFAGVYLISIAKRFEHLYSKSSNRGIILDKDSPALRLLMKVRDEAHRFAVSYHRTLRGKALKQSFLDDIPGIGETRKRLILQKYSSRDELACADTEELMEIPGMNRKIASKILFKVLSQ